MAIQDRYGFPQGEFHWQADFKAEKNREGKVTATHSLICHREDVLQFTPNTGASCQREGYTILKFDSATIEEIDVPYARVNCKYIGTNLDEDGGGGDAGGAGGASARHILSVTTSEEPIETNPRYEALTAEDLKAFSALKAGRLTITGVDPNIKYTITKVGANNKPVTNVLELSDLGVELITKYERGFTSYLTARQNLRIEFTSNARVPASVLSKVGFIDEPPNAPLFGGGRDWISLGATQEEEGGVYNIAYEWLLSELDGWDEIYEKP